MSVENVGGVQPLSIHNLSVRKICRFFSLEITSSNLRNLILRVVDLYNRNLQVKEDEYYDAKIRENPFLSVEKFEPFKVCVYVQVIRRSSRLSTWLEELGAVRQVIQRVNYIFFYFRERIIGDRVFKEVFALTTGQAFQVIQKFSDYRFPTAVARRLMDPKLQKADKRPIVGPVLLMTEVLKQAVEVSDTDAVDKLFTRAKFRFRDNSSIFNLRCFQDAKGKPLTRGMSAEIGLGLVRISKEIHPERYPEILHHLSEIVHKQKTFCNEGKKEEVDSDGFDFLDHFQPTDFTLVPQLDKALLRALSNFFYHNGRLPPFDFCHKKRREFFQATKYELYVNNKRVQKPWGIAPSMLEVMEALRKRVPQDENEFSQWLNTVEFGFGQEVKMERALFINYLEGELRLKEGPVYWRLHNMWFEIHADYLGLVHQEFRKMLVKRLMVSEMLSSKWPSPKQKEARKKALNGKRYDIEGEFNRNFFDKPGYLLGDKICPFGIELADIFYFGNEKVIFFHVKEGFDHHVRDGCSQILNAAKMLHQHGGRMKTPINVLEQFYDMALQGGNEYRMKVKAQMKCTKKEFVENFDNKKFVFVYAFADKAKKQRLLSKEKDIPSVISGLEIAHPKFLGKREELHENLIKDGYLSNKRMLTTKFLHSSKKDFKFDSLTVKLQRDAVFDCLVKSQTQFDSTIAKLELLTLKEEIRKLGYKFKILQIDREDYVPESQAAIARVNEEQFELDELTELDDAEREAIRGDIGEGDSFIIDNEKFDIIKTAGGGACGLHALVGLKVDGTYTYPGGGIEARTEFIKRLTAKKDEMQQSWEKWMVDALKDYLGKNPSIYTKMMFEGFDFNEFSTSLSELNDEKAELQSTQESFFTEVCDSEGCQKALKDVINVPIANLKINPKQMCNMFTESLDEVITALELSELSDAKTISESLKTNIDSLKVLQEKREQFFIEFVKQKEVWVTYLKVIANKDYYFSNLELKMAASLFEKHVVIYKHTHLDQVTPAEEGGDENHERVVIFHKGDHFSRCESKTDS